MSRNILHRTLFSQITCIRICPSQAVLELLGLWFEQNLSTAFQEFHICENSQICPQHRQYENWLCIWWWKSDKNFEQKINYHENALGPAHDTFSGSTTKFLDGISVVCSLSCNAWNGFKKCRTLPCAKRIRNCPMNRLCRWINHAIDSWYIVPIYT